MVSAVILTKNEEENILKCIKSLSWCDEIIVLDDNSTDKTIEKLKKANVKLFSREMNNDFSAQRNFGLSIAKGEWVLFIDADERVSPALWYEIMQRTNGVLDNYAGFYIKRVDTLFGRNLKHGETGNAELLRLAKKNAGLWVGKVHETWKIKGKKETLSNPLFHSPHKSVRDFLKEINHYTNVRAEELYEKNVKAFWWSIVAYPGGKFIVNYVFKLGFLDGLPGLVLALMMSFHSFLVRSKLWLLWQKRVK